jgi:nucleotide-binding universal stress UspA family protein
MTTHSHGGLARFWLGSVADALVHVSPVPVLSLRPGEAVPHTNHPPVFQNILIPLDGSALAEDILKPALALGDRTRAAYTLLQWPNPYVLTGYAPLVQSAELDGQMTQAALAQGQRYLDGLGQRLRTHGRSIHVRVVLAAQSAVAILDAARAYSVDLITLATHGRTELAHLLIGSVADIVRAARICRCSCTGRRCRGQSIEQGTNPCLKCGAGCGIGKTRPYAVTWGHASG